MEISLSPSQDGGFGKARDYMRLKYTDYESNLTSNRRLYYTENDVKNDIVALLSTFPTRRRGNLRFVIMIIISVRFMYSK